jgi:hypothetical protein
MKIHRKRLAWRLVDKKSIIFLRTVHVQQNGNEIRLADNAALAIRGELHSSGGSSHVGLCKAGVFSLEDPQGGYQRSSSLNTKVTENN